MPKECGMHGDDGMTISRRRWPRAVAEQASPAIAEPRRTAAQDRGVIFPVDAERETGSAATTSEMLEVLPKISTSDPCSIDPHKGKLGVREAETIEEYGVRGFKLSTMQGLSTTGWPIRSGRSTGGAIALFHRQTGVERHARRHEIA
jgi:hypothetical protein